MVRATRHRHAYADYVRIAEYSNVKLEYHAGEIDAMAGGTPEHAALAFAFAGIVGKQLPERCRGFTSDLRVRIVESDMATHPDLTIVWGEMVRAEDDRMAVTNPVVVVEVTSEGTELYDRNEKREHYQRVPTLREIVLVSHRERRIEVWRRGEDGWTSAAAGPSESIVLESIGVRVPVDEVYRGVSS
jgi:Uma2 family endonuclease